MKTTVDFAQETPEDNLLEMFEAGSRSIDRMIAETERIQIDQQSRIDSEIGHYRIISKLDVAPSKIFGSQSTMPSDSFQKVTASGKSNQFENALAFLEKDGVVHNVMLYKGAQVVISPSADSSDQMWLVTNDCEKRCYLRLKIYQLGPNIPCSPPAKPKFEATVAKTVATKEVVETEKVEETKVETNPEVSEGNPCERDFDTECVRKGKTRRYYAEEDIYYTPVVSALPKVVLVEQETHLSLDGKPIEAKPVPPHRITK